MVDSAQDQRRYDLLKDVKRLEQVVSEGFVDVGIAICLTNDYAYWNPPSQVRETIFEAFVRLALEGIDADLSLSLLFFVSDDKNIILL